MPFSLESQRARIERQNEAHRKNKRYFRRVRVRDYLPGQVTYSLGDYPARIDAAPTEYDRVLLKRLAEGGVQLVQLHEEWNDACRLYGGDKFNAVNREGMKQFVALCHSLGMKVIPYLSSGFIQQSDPDFIEAFCRTTRRCRANYYNYREGSAGNALWRSYILPRTFEAMDTYGFDGAFNDWGYDGIKPGTGCLEFFRDYDPELEDLLGQIYTGIKARGGVYKIHADRNNVPPCIDKVYDYLWIGEWVESSPIGVGKDYPLYVVPCLDRHRDPSVTQKAHLAQTVPFLQFPLLKHGRPLKGNNLALPGVTYYGGDEEAFFGEVKNFAQSHPDGPHTYSLWSSVPDDPEELELWLSYLKLYRPMVSENSLCYMQLKESEYILSEIKEEVIATMFVNEKTYLAVSNLSEEPYTLILGDLWQDRQTGRVARGFLIPVGEMVLLELREA